MLPTVSIIIPTYNRAILIGETLDSIIAQTYLNWECIVVDDGSTDYTEELMDFYINRDPRISYVKRPENRKKGANACRNYGFELSQGKFINWFDDDDIMHPQKLEIQTQNLNFSDYNFCVCQTLVFEKHKNNIIGLRNQKINSNNPFFDFLRMEISWLTQAPLWKRTFLERLDYLYDEELQGAQEWEFHLRVLNESPNYDVISEGLVFLRKHEESVTYNKNEYQRFFNYFLARFKIYNNQKLNLSEESVQFLKDYLLNSFKKMIVTKNPYVLKSFKVFIIPEKDMAIITKINALISMFTYKSADKGNFILQKIRYK